MALPNTLLDAIREAEPSPTDWFSIEKIRERDPQLEVAAQYVQQDTGKELVIRRDEKELYKKLEEWAARLLEHQVRFLEQAIMNASSEHSFVPTPDDDAALRDEIMRFIDSSVEQVKQEMSGFTGYTPDQFYSSWSPLDNAAASLRDEVSTSVPLAGELARLEIVESDHVAVDTLGYAQVRIERFLSDNYARIPHPFQDGASLALPRDLLSRIVRLVTYVIFKAIDESRLNGFETKFRNVFLHYLSSSRESSAGAADRVSALFEPFLKKLAFVVDAKDANGTPIWPHGLEGLVRELRLTNSDLKNADAKYWEGQAVEDAVLRMAYQLRHKAAHEAHGYAYYEHERYAYFVIAALLVSAKIVLESDPNVAKVVEHQADVDAVRDLFVKIEDLAIGPDGPRLSGSGSVPRNRLEKLLAANHKAQTVWPTCSPNLRGLLESEYLTVRAQLIDKDREADIEAYLEDMRADQY